MAYELQADFQAEVLDASHDIPIVVDFWAAWCGPCQVLGPVLESLAQESREAWRLVKVDTERFPQLAAEYRIQGIPARPCRRRAAGSTADAGER